MGGKNGYLNSNQEVLLKGDLTVKSRYERGVSVCVNTNIYTHKYTHYLREREKFGRRIKAIIFLKRSIGFKLHGVILFSVTASGHAHLFRL